MRRQTAKNNGRSVATGAVAYSYGNDTNVSNVKKHGSNGELMSVLRNTKKWLARIAYYAGFYGVVVLLALTVLAYTLGMIALIMMALRMILP